MVLLWSALAARRVNLMTQTLRAMPEIPHGRAWITYVRCHDDIGWAITEDNAAAVGEDAHEHRKFLVRYFSGDFWESFARGAVFQPELNGEGRTSGTAASLAGVEVALERGDEAALDLALRRLFVLYGIAFSYGGLPLIYMGDELGLRNDDGYARDPLAAADNRWLHRPHMDWDAAARRDDPGTLEGRMFAGLRELVAARRACPALHAAGTVAAARHGQPARLRLPPRPWRPRAACARQLQRARAGGRRPAGGPADRRRRARVRRAAATCGRLRDPRAVRDRVADLRRAAAAPAAAARLSGQPLTAPAVRPATIRFWKSRTMMISGIEIVTDAA